MEEPRVADDAGWKGMPQVGIYGWRKRCLYLLILTLLVLVILNLALTLWVLRVMEFNSEGMGNVRIVEGGLEVTGQSYVLGSLAASTISSGRGRSLQIRASHNISISSEWGHRNSIVLGKDTLEVKANKFRVSDQSGRSLFYADQREVVVGAESLRVTGEGGILVEGSLQTPLVRANPGADLSLESPTRTLQVMGPSGVSIESRAGAISASCLDNFKLESHDGAIKLESSKIVLEGLKTASPRGTSSLLSHSEEKTLSQVYQLCACLNGKLFLAPADGICAADNESLVCR